MTNRFVLSLRWAVWSICRAVIDIARRWAVPSPDIDEIMHYAICGRCRSDFEAQDWLVQFRHHDKEIYEVTFNSRAISEHTHFGECVHEEGEEEAEEVERPERLTVRHERPIRPKARFYV